MTTFRSTAGAGSGARALAVVCVVGLGLSAVPSFLFNDARWIGAAVLALGLLLGALLWTLRLTVTLTRAELVLGGHPLFGFTHRVPREQIVAACTGYHLDGVGFGFGRRLEGRRDRVWRASGPEVTLKLADASRIAFSTPEPDAFLAALDAPSTDVSRTDEEVNNREARPR